ncbi:MAG TPA: glycoside hydrolase family 18 protein [Chthonomonadaceae bacterium]|nr:glycoside hydrolase family 18 protein [Chthonomonadaceae bacterium]
MTICALLLVFAMLSVYLNPDRETAAPETRETPFRVIGYLPEYRVAAFDPKAARSVTDIVYFSIQPEPSGALKMGATVPGDLKQLRDIKKHSGVRLLIALGGWERSQGFSPMTRNMQARARFVQELTHFCRDNGLDGADFDWEHPADAVEEAAYAGLLEQVRQSFHPRHLLVSLTVATWQKPDPASFRAADRVQLMSYDNAGCHSTLAQAQADIETFLQRGVPPQKLILGLPFYGRSLQDFNQDRTYADIVRQYHPQPDADEAAGIFFNGIRTIQQKVQTARQRGLGGVMIWELGQDTSDSTSLLAAIHQVLAK